MTSTQPQIRTAERLAEAYVASRGKSHFLSVRLGIRAIRTLMPFCEASDRELADLLAAASVQHGIANSFDGCTGSRKNASATGLASA